MAPPIPMDPHSYTRLSEIVALVLEAEESDREQLLKEACDGDGELMEAARRLLSFADPSEGAFSDDSIEQQRDLFDDLLDGSGDEADGELTQTGDGWLPPRIGSYEVLRTIGRGGTGVVFEARQERPSRSVAIKLLHPAFATGETVTRLRREAEVLGRLRHVGIAQIFEAGVFDAGAGEQPYLAIELIDGPDLLTYAQGAGLDERGRISLLCRVADAVAHAHQKGVVHRDLKPDNILVESATGEPKLLDFGIAGADELDASLRVTAEGQLLGTVGYMAPEQARRSVGEVGPPTDVYSLAAIAYELLLHRPLRQVGGLSLTQALSELAERDSPRLRDAAAGLSKDLATIIEKGLELRPSDRYQSAEELSADLRRWLDRRPILARSPSRIDRALKFTRRNPVLVTGVTATTTALLLGLAATAHQARLAKGAEDRARRELYAAEMVLGTRDLNDPATSQQSNDRIERWKPTRELRAQGIEPGFEWHLLDSVRRRRAVELDVMGPPLPIAWSPDGSRVAVGTGDELSVHDAGTGKGLASVSVRALPENQNASVLLTSLHWAADSPTTIYYTGIHARGAWDVRDDQLLWSDAPEFSAAATIVPDGRLFALREDYSLEILDAATGALLSRKEGPWYQGSNIDRHAATGRLLLPSRNWGAIIHSEASLAPAASSMSSQDNMTWLRWHPAGDRVAIAFFSGEIKIMSVAPWEEILSIQVHGETAFSVDWSDDGRYLASSSSDRTVRIYDAETGALLRSFVGHTRPVRQVHFAPDDGSGKTRLASVGSSGRVIVWDADEPDAVRKVKVDGFGPFDLGAQLVWRPQLERVIAWDRAHRLRVPVGEEAPMELTLGGGRAYLSADGRWTFRIISGEEYAVENEGGEVVLPWQNPGRDPFLMGAWHPRKPLFAAALLDGVFLFEIVDDVVQPPVPIAPLGVQVAEVAWNSAGTAVAVATLSGFVLGVAVPSGEELFRFELESPIGSNCVTWSPTGDRVAIGCSDGALRILHARSPLAAREQVLRGHGGEIKGVAWHPDGRRIATASRDRTVKLWDPDAGHLVGSLECEDLLSDVVWADKGRSLFAVDLAGRLYTFDASRSLDERVGEGPAEAE